MYPARRCSVPVVPSSEIAFLFFALHRGGAVVVDHAIAPLREAALDRLADDLGERGRAAFEGARQRIATERAKAHGADLRLLAGLKRHAIVIHHDQGAAALDDRARRRQVTRNDWNPLLVDVEPDVELGPVGERKD